MFPKGSLLARLLTLRNPKTKTAQMGCFRLAQREGFVTHHFSCERQEKVPKCAGGVPFL